MTTPNLKQNLRNSLERMSSESLRYVNKTAEFNLADIHKNSINFISFDDLDYPFAPQEKILASKQRSSVHSGNKHFDDNNNSINECKVELDSAQLSVLSKDSLDMLRDSKQFKKLNAFKAYYFTPNLLILKLHHINTHGTLAGIWEHNVQTIVNVTENKNQSEWKKIKSINIEHANLSLKDIETEGLSNKNIATLVQPYAQCLMGVVEKVLRCKKGNLDDEFRYAGIQHKAYENIMQIIEKKFEMNKNENKKEVYESMCDTRLNLQQDAKFPKEHHAKVLIVDDCGMGNAAFLAIGCRMLFHEETLQKCYTLFRHHVRLTPKLNKMHTYVLQSLEFSMFQKVSMSMKEINYYTVQKAMKENGLASVF